MTSLSTVFGLIIKRHFPVVLGSNLVFLGVSLKTEVNCWVDFGWVFNQFLVASMLFWGNPITAFSATGYALVSTWAFRLGKI